MKLTVRTLATISLGTLLVATFATGCSKSSGTGSASTTASTVGGALASADVAAKLTKAGWTLATNDAEERDGWPSRYIQMEKGNEADYRKATVWIDALGESLEGAPKPHIEMGKGALIRFASEPSAKGKGPELAAFAKDIVAVTAPEKATDGLFNSDGYDKAVKKHALVGGSDGSGGRVSPMGVVFNHRTPSTKDGGRVAIEIVHMQKALETGKAQLFGTTLVSVDADDAVRKEVFAALAK